MKMVKQLTVPNLRKCFVVDPGYVMVDADLKGADARTVAWEADDEPLKYAFRKGIDIHTYNAQTLFPGETIDYAKRQRAKIACHAVNYVCGERTLAEHIGTTVGEARSFINQWFTLHPGIRDWHHRTDRQLRSRKWVENKFGYRRTYFDRPEGILPEAIAWIGQSTTACAINRAIVALNAEMGDEIQILLQTHDNVTFQIPEDALDAAWLRITTAMMITVPYSDPMPMPCDYKVGYSWGELKPYAP